MLLLLLLHLRHVLASTWGYPQCTEALCIGPLVGLNDSCVTNTSCACRSSSYLSNFASCVGTLCNYDLPKAYLASKTGCAKAGFPDYPLDDEEWASAGDSSWTSLVAGHYSTAPAAPAVTADVLSWWTEYAACSRYVCVVPTEFYLYSDPHSPLAPLLKDANLSCLLTENLEYWAACYGTFCPNERAQDYSNIQDGCDKLHVKPALSFEQWLSATHGDPIKAYDKLVSALVTSTSSSSRSSSRSSSTISTISRYTQYGSSAPTATASEVLASPTPASGAHRGLSKGAKVGLGVGLGLGLPLLLIGVLVAAIHDDVQQSKKSRAPFQHQSQQPPLPAPPSSPLPPAIVTEPEPEPPWLWSRGEKNTGSRSGDRY